MVQPEPCATRWQWQIVARYNPEPDGSGLKMLDIAAAVDGVQIPFTFEEEGQIFESVTSSHMEPGIHRFELKPSPVPSQSFPALLVEFEAP
jgi:hypothetical protein